MVEWTVVLYGRAECHLCEAAEAALLRLAHEFGFRLDVVDIEGDQKLERLYALEIPVVALDQDTLLRAPFDEASLRAALRRYTQAGRVISP